MKLVKILFFLLLVGTFSTANAQAWCSEKYKPALDLMDNKKSPDYGKKYTFYFFCTAKSLTTDQRCMTKIYKATLTNYDSDYLRPGRDFAGQLKEDTTELLKSKFPDDKAFRGHIFGDVYTNYCQNIEDLIGQYETILNDSEGRGMEIVLLESLQPNPTTYYSNTQKKDQRVAFEELN